MERTRYALHGKVTDLETLGRIDEESERATRLLRVMESFFVDWHRAVGCDTEASDYYVAVRRPRLHAAHA